MKYKQVINPEIIKRTFEGINDDPIRSEYSPSNKWALRYEVSGSLIRIETFKTRKEAQERLELLYQYENVVIKLNYTDEMKEMDKLWENEEEDTTIMERLFNEIVEEAKEKGFDGVVDIYQGPREAIADVYNSQEEMASAQLSGIETTCYGYCKPLIEHLEERISMLRLIDYVKNNEDLFDQRGLSKEVFYNEIMGFINMAYESQSPVTILTVKDSLEEIITFIIDEFVSEELTNDKLYDIFTEEDIYVYKLNETNQYILIKK